MKEYKEKKGEKYPSLYDAFQLGDRVMRMYQDKYGKKTEYRGIILKIEKAAWRFIGILKMEDINLVK